MFTALKKYYQTYLFPFRLYIAATAIFLAVVLLFTSNNDQVEIVTLNQITLKLASPTELNLSQSTELIGTVSAKTEAKLLSEISGRVTSVNVALGQSVTAGQVVATLENASERAGVLQAEGSYEASLAAAEQSGVGVNEAANNYLAAQNKAFNTYQAAYNTSSGIVSGTIDQFFAAPLSTVPGLKLNGRGYTDSLNVKRVNLQTTLNAWREKSQTAVNEKTIFDLLAQARKDTEDILAMTDVFLTILQDQGASDRYSTTDTQNAITNFNNARATLTNTLNSIDAAETTLTAAIETKKRAYISATTSGGVSSSDAQIKQALGALRSAEANLAKTIIRTPITGQINSLTIKTGDYLSAFTPIADVANNNGLEITTYIGANERDLLTIGSTLTIAGAGTGTVTNISPAIDEATGKIEVKVAVASSSLQNGDRVRLFIAKVSNASSNKIEIPLRAVKFDGASAYVFLVIDGLLARQDVTLGDVSGDRVEVLTGLTDTTKIVTDARGKVAGTAVSVSE